MLINLKYFSKILNFQRNNLVVEFSIVIVQIPHRPFYGLWSLVHCLNTMPQDTQTSYTQAIPAILLP